MKFCYSCGAPITEENKSKKENYCDFCVDENGNLYEKEEILHGIAHWFLEWQPNIDHDTAMKRAEYYLKSMPHWADKRM